MAGISCFGRGQRLDFHGEDIESHRDRIKLVAVSILQSMLTELLNEILGKKSIKTFLHNKSLWITLKGQILWFK